VLSVGRAALQASHVCYTAICRLADPCILDYRPHCPFQSLRWPPPSYTHPPTPAQQPLAVGQRPHSNHEMASQRHKTHISTPPQQTLQCPNHKGSLRPAVPATGARCLLLASPSGSTLLRIRLGATLSGGHFVPAQPQPGALHSGSPCTMLAVARPSQVSTRQLVGAAAPRSHLHGGGLGRRSVHRLQQRLHGLLQLRTQGRQSAAAVSPRPPWARLQPPCLAARSCLRLGRGAAGARRQKGAARRSTRRQARCLWARHSPAAAAARCCRIWP
jgi:hypothetical protein